MLQRRWERVKHKRVDNGRITIVKDLDGSSVSPSSKRRILRIYKEELRFLQTLAL